MTLVDVGGLYRIGYRMPSCVLLSPCAAERVRRFGKEFPMKSGLTKPRGLDIAPVGVYCVFGLVMV